MLEIEALSVAYGGLRALSDVSLPSREGQFVTIVGPNGAGKTTLFKTISRHRAAVAAAASASRDATCWRCRRRSARISASPMCRKAARCSTR